MGFPLGREEAPYRRAGRYGGLQARTLTALERAFAPLDHAAFIQTELELRAEGGEISVLERQYECTEADQRGLLLSADEG